MSAAFRDVDSLITAYRCHGWTYTRGWSVKSILAELFGKPAVSLSVLIVSLPVLIVSTSCSI